MSRTEKGDNGYKKGDRHRKGYYKEYYWKKKREGNPHSWIKPNPFRADYDEEEDKSDFDDYYDSFGARGGMSVTDIYMKGWNDLLYVLAFRKENDDGDSYVYPVLVFLGRDDNPFYEVVHSKEAFIRLAGQKNWDYFVKNMRINWNLYKIA